MAVRAHYWLLTSTPIFWLGFCCRQGKSQLQVSFIITSNMTSESAVELINSTVQGVFNVWRSPKSLFSIHLSLLINFKLNWYYFHTVLACSQVAQSLVSVTLGSVIISSMSCSFCLWLLHCPVFIPRSWGAFKLRIPWVGPFLRYLTASSLSPDSFSQVVK